MQDRLKRYRESIRIGTELAQSDRKDLVPFLGAGTSAPLGLPLWNRFIEILAGGTGISSEELNNAEPPDILQRVKEALKPTEFVSRVQHALRLSTDRISLTLQALARIDVRMIVTTNLDFAIERAYAMGGRPIPPHQVYCGSTANNLRVEISPEDPVQLFKIHGSLERPDTWILTRDDYDQAYVAREDLHDFFNHSIHIPFFLGCGFTDYDVKHMIRVANISRRKRSYAVLGIQKASELDGILRQQGIIPIYFHTFDQIPEILDDVFGMKPLRIAEVNVVSSIEDSSLQVGCLRTNLPPLVNDQSRHLIIRILANAIEGRPNRSIVTNETRRVYGQKGQFKRDIHDLLQSHQDHISLFRVVCKALVQCPELILESVLPTILQAGSIDHYLAVRDILSVSRNDSYLSRSIETLLLQHVHDPSLQISTLRAIAKLLAERGNHPSQAISPTTIVHGTLAISVYPLTNYQIGLLRSDKALQDLHPVRPYTLKSFAEIREILGRLAAETCFPWRLPKKSEWLSFAGRNPKNMRHPENHWPWGEQAPARGMHAHIDFRTEGGGWARHPLEVGIFPHGKSALGLFDIVGNVYEAAEDEDGQVVLAGGSWTMRYRGESPKNFRWTTIVTTGQGNVGIRPVYDT
jgi:hypothetical protein